MNEMQIFNNEEFGSVRVVEMNDEPWMVGKDVAQALGYADTFGALKSMLMKKISKTAKTAVLKAIAV